MIFSLVRIDIRLQVVTYNLFDLQITDFSTDELSGSSGAPKDLALYMRLPEVCSS